MITFGDDTVSLTLLVGDDKVVRIVDLSHSGASHNRTEDARPIVEVLTVDSGSWSPGRYDDSSIGRELTYVSHHADESTLHVHLRDEGRGLEAAATFTLFGGGSLRCELTLRNAGTADLNLLTTPTLAIASDRWDMTNTKVHLAANDWLSEYRWRSGTLLELGQAPIEAAVHSDHLPRGRFTVTGFGTWSSGEYLPMGALEAADGTAMAWQIESHSSWTWQVGPTRSGVVLIAGGPTDREHGWSRRLRPGEEHHTTPVTIAVGANLGDAFEGITRYRRATRLPSTSDSHLPVVFNDYMNTLMADPTTEKLLPLIAAAAKAGAEVFCVDAGWYANEPGWWDSVGEWEPSTTRFRNGIGEVFDAIRSAGMSAGIWLEPEVIGVRSKIASTMPDDAFFQRRGTRVTMDGRHHLDLRHPAATAHLDSVVDRLVDDFDIGFFKFDYNISAWAGTDVGAWSSSDGALQASRAHLDWIDSLRVRHPHLILENCASGGMRNDWAAMSRFDMASTSDQQDVYLTVPIAAAAASAVLPEQAGVWCYPQPGMPDLEAGVTMANGILGRPYLSGHFDKMSDVELDRVRGFVETYRSIRLEIPSSTPSWPLGLPGWQDDWVAFALKRDGSALMTVWRRGGGETHTIPWRGMTSQSTIDVVYDASNGAARMTARNGEFSISLPENSAVTLRMSHEPL